MTKKTKEMPFITCLIKDENGVYQRHTLTVRYPTPEQFRENMETSLRRVIEEELGECYE